VVRMPRLELGPVPLSPYLQAPNPYHIASPFLPLEACKPDLSFLLPPRNGHFFPFFKIPATLLGYERPQRLTQGRCWYFCVIFFPRVEDFTLPCSPQTLREYSCLSLICYIVLRPNAPLPLLSFSGSFLPGKVGKPSTTGPRIWLCPHVPAPATIFFLPPRALDFFADGR